MKIGDKVTWTRGALGDDAMSHNALNIAAMKRALETLERVFRVEPVSKYHPPSDCRCLRCDMETAITALKTRIAAMEE